MTRSRWPAALGVLIFAAAFACAGWLALAAWQVQSALASARAQIAVGRHAEARERLVQIDRYWPRDDEAIELLGTCEAALGHTDEAIAAWSRIPEGSRRAGAARLAMGRLLVRPLGRLGDAEEAFRSAIRQKGPQAAEARWALAELLLWEGRIDEMRRLLEAIGRIGAPADRAVALREHWRLDSMVVSEEELRPILDRAEKTAPGDGYVMLARARLATQYGRFDAARDWLDRCENGPARSDSRLARILSVARLRWALGADKPDEARRAVAAARSEHFELTELWSLRAWFAAHRGDRETETRALEQVVAIEPGDTRALDRLAELATLAGQADRARTLRRRREEAQRDQERYRRLLIADHATPSIDELRERARLADRLGRSFEAEGWWTLALEREPHDREAQTALDRRTARDEAAATNPSVPAFNSLVDAAGIDLTDPRDRVPVPEASTAAIAFGDDAERARLGFTYQNGATPEHQIPETIGGGVAVLDLDGDGWLDVFLVQGGPFPPGDPPRSAAGDRLFHNRGDGTFDDVTEASGIARMTGGYGFGVSVGDYDNDGRPDVFVTRFGSYALYHNRGDGTFEDATERAGLAGPRDWPTSSAFADLDGDGDLDLYVCHYLAWDASNPTLCTDPRAPGRHVSCLPLGFPAMPDHLFRNDGGRFVDVTAEAGIVDQDGRGLGVVAADLDGDGRLDLFVANDMTANRLYRNRGGLKFEEIGHLAGVACNADGGYQAGMGVACGDSDGDGRPDLAVTNFFGESTTLYRNLGDMAFADATAAAGLKAPSRFLLGFGTVFLDVDNDGRLDLATANGHIHDLRPSVPYPMPAQLLGGGADGRLTDVTARVGEPWTVPRIGRGLASADLDNDGRVDLLLVSQNTPLAYFHNQTRDAGHWLTLRLEGTASNRDAIGAKIALTADGRRQTAWRNGGGSYVSASDPRIHFGLGSSSTASDVEIRWPSGRLQRFGTLAADRIYHLREGDPLPRTLSPFAGPGGSRR